jgi:hypothetical protein
MGASDMTSKTFHSTCVAQGDMRRETLPLPVIHYPQLRGTFIAFASDAQSAPTLCDCAIPAVENLFRLRPELTRAAFSEALHAYFPYEIARRIATGRTRDVSGIKFSSGLCHRCNQTAPALQFSDDACDPDFVQTFGWYVNQAYLRFGILPGKNTYLKDACPTEYRKAIEDARLAERAFHHECQRLLESNFSSNTEASPNVCECRFLLEDAEEMVALRQRASMARKGLKCKVENLVRQEVGYQQQWLSA